MFPTGFKKKKCHKSSEALIVGKCTDPVGSRPLPICHFILSECLKTTHSRMTSTHKVLVVFWERPQAEGKHTMTKHLAVRNGCIKHYRNYNCICLPCESPHLPSQVTRTPGLGMPGKSFTVHTELSASEPHPTNGLCQQTSSSCVHKIV